MSHRCHALGALSHENPVVGAHGLKTNLDATVLVEDPGAQVGDVLTGRLDQVLDRLEDARANRPVGHGEDPLALEVDGQRSGVEFDRSDRLSRSRPRAGRSRVEREDQRVEAGMLNREEAEEVVDLSLVPGGRRDRQCCGHEFAGVPRQQHILAEQGSVLCQHVAKPGPAVLGNGEECTEPSPLGDVRHNAPDDCLLIHKPKVLLGRHRGTLNSLAA